MMDPVVSVVLAWLVFAGTHIGMASAPARGPLAARFGDLGFQAVFSLVAALGFALLCYVYALAGNQGPAGLALGASAWLRWPLMAINVLGVVCVFGSLLDYPTSAYALSRAGRKSDPRGFERITRHGFAVGLALVGIAHALLAARLTGTVFFAALAVFGIVGSIHQDAKLRARNPALHGPYMEKSSLLPFAAILAGRNRLVLSELRPLAVALGVLGAWGLREMHPYIFSRGGLYVTGVVLAGAMIASAQDARRALRRARRAADSARVTPQEGRSPR
ncbi:MAG: hypothetical protein HY899_16975 [Deltaproteobacteria bacterium]|nr:hypothetical protein [Deltaproteobacteria bacterium]